MQEPIKFDGLLRYASKGWASWSTVAQYFYDLPNRVRGAPLRGSSPTIPVKS